MEITHIAFRYACIAAECAWQTFVIPPKGKVEFWGINLVEFIWNTKLGVVNHKIWAAVIFHNVLYGLRVDQGTGTTSLDVKRIHKMADMR